MNITEDKFLNKSAEEIVSDVLSDCKDSPRDALNTIKSLLNGKDGLSLSDEVKQELEKACDMLTSKVNTNKDTYFIVDSFDGNKPETFLLENSTNELIDKTYNYLREQYPNAAITTKNKVGSHCLYENSSTAVFIAIKLANGTKEYYNTDSLPHAKVMVKKLKEINPEKYEDAKITVKKKNATKDELKSTIAKNGVIQNLAAIGLGGLTGISPAFTKGVSNWMLNRFSRDDKEYNLSEDTVLTADDLIPTSYIDSKKDIADIDERLSYSLHGIHPNMADKRRPKWFNTITNHNTRVELERRQGKFGEVMLILNGIERTDEEPKDSDFVIVTEKVPVDYNDENGSMTYKNGKSYYIPVGAFKQMINDPKNAEILADFTKKHPEDPGFMIDFDLYAKQNLDKQYPDWEDKYYDTYNLDMYSLPERANIYLRWKEANKDKMYQKAHELTPEEVIREFGIPHLIKQAKDKNFLSKKQEITFNNLLTSLPADKGKKLQTAFENVLINSETKEDFDNAFNEWNNQAILYATENKINQATNNSLTNLDSNVDQQELDNNKKQEYLNDKESILKKYINPDLNIPLIRGKEDQVKRDIEALKNKYLILQNSDFENIKAIHKKTIDAINSKYNNIDYTTDDLTKLKQVNKTEADYEKWVKGTETVDRFLNTNYKAKNADFIDPRNYTVDRYIDYLRSKEIENAEKHKWDTSENPKEIELSQWKSLINDLIKVKKGKDKEEGILDDIDNRIHRINDKDSKGYPLSNKYMKLFNDKIEQWQKEYDPESPALAKEIKTFYKELVDELKKPTTMTQELEKYL